jgi:hypothetical protein
MSRTLAILLMLAAPVAAGEVMVTVSSFPPGQELKPGVTVLVQARGVPSEQEFAWDLIPAPSPGETIELSTREGPLMLFASTASGPRTVFLQLAFPGLDPKVRCDFDYGGQPPNPGPNPGPSPPPDVGPLHVLFLYETDNVEDPMPAQQRDIVTSRLVLSYLADKCSKTAGHPNYRFLDDDSDLSKMPYDWQEVAARAKTDRNFETPWVVIANDKGGSFEGPWPEDPAAMLELLKKYGGE